jgi:hypothetical protein
MLNIVELGFQTEKNLGVVPTTLIFLQNTLSISTEVAR